MKRLASLFLAALMVCTLAACGEGGLNLNPNRGNEEPSLKEGYIGDKMATYWFDFTVNSAFSCEEYEGYAPSAGNKLVVLELTLKNTFGESIDMWREDFVILWDDPDENSGVDIPLPAGISGDQFPDEYPLGINATKTGLLIYEVPTDFRDFAVAFQELKEDLDDPTGDGIEGDTHAVYFTPEEQ